LWERNVQDGESHTLLPSVGDVATGVRRFFHSYIRTGECAGYEDGDEVTVEAQGHWYGIDMMRVVDPHGGCYWIAAVDLRGSDDDFGAARRRWNSYVEEAAPKKSAWPQMDYAKLTIAELANGVVTTETAIRWCREILDGLQESKTVGMQAVVKAIRDLLPKLEEDLKVLERAYANAKKRERQARWSDVARASLS
jgi:hypothetical protein